MQGEYWDSTSVWIDPGPFAKLVFLILALMFLQTLFVWISRSLRYLIERRKAKGLLHVLGAEPLELETINAAIEGSHSGALGRVLHAGVSTFQGGGIQPALLADFAMRRAQWKVFSEMKLGQLSLATISVLAMFVGTFGTLIGILNSFRSIDMEKSAALAFTVGAIAMALVPTAIALIVATFSSWAHNSLARQLEVMNALLEEGSLRLIVWFRQQQNTQADRNPEDICPLTTGLLTGDRGAEIPSDRETFVMFYVWPFLAFFAFAIAAGLWEHFKGR